MPKQHRRVSRGDRHGADPEDTDALVDVLYQQVGAVIVVGTRLQIPGLKTFMKEMRTEMECSEGMVVWVSHEPPKANTGLKSRIVPFIGGCDDFASYLKDKQRPVLFKTVVDKA